MATPNGSASSTPTAATTSRRRCARRPTVSSTPSSVETAARAAEPGHRFSAGERRLTPRRRRRPRLPSPARPLPPRCLPLPRRRARRPCARPWRGRGRAGDGGADAGGVLGHGLLGPLDEVRPLPLGGQLGGSRLGGLLHVVLEGRHRLERVVEHDPDDPHPGRRLGRRPRRFRLRLGRRLRLLLGLTFDDLFLVDFLDDLFGLVFHRVEGFGGLPLPPQFQAIQRFPSH